jgi:nicotinamidase/pyrazinamidase
MKRNINFTKADILLVTDVQVDFLPGGALPVPEGDQVLPILNDYIRIFRKAGVPIFATRDWHPPNHMSFTTQGGPWPPHCVQDSEGARFHPDLKLPEDTVIISKAMNPAKESYSSFDNTELASMLALKKICQIFICGFATDYCVVNTVLDARKLGFETVILLDAIRGIDVKPGDSERAIEEIIAKGSKQATLEDFPYSLDVPLTEETGSDEIGEKPLSKFEFKKKARMRPRGPYKKVRTEKG